MLPRRLADFGLSRMLEFNATHVSTQTFGTVPYMPHELLSDGRMGKSADVSAAGSICIALLSRLPCLHFELLHLVPVSAALEPLGLHMCR